jgi:hypothetical protein
VEVRAHRWLVASAHFRRLLRIRGAHSLTALTIDPGCAGAGCLEAFKAHPSVFVQWPETQSSAFADGTAFGVFGHCVFHDTELDLAPLAGATIPTNAGPVTLGGRSRSRTIRTS